MSEREYSPVTHYADGTPRDWIAMDIRAADYRTLAQLADLWRCSRENALGILCRAVRLQVWPLGDVLTSYPEFQSWVERIVRVESAPLRRGFGVEFACGPGDIDEEARRPSCRRCDKQLKGDEEGLCEQCADCRDAYD